MLYTYGGTSSAVMVSQVRSGLVLLIAVVVGISIDRAMLDRELPLVAKGAIAFIYAFLVVNIAEHLRGNPHDMVKAGIVSAGLTTGYIVLQIL